MVFPVRTETYPSDTASAVGSENDPDLVHVAQLAHQVREKLVAMNETTAHSAAAAIAAQDDWNGTERKPAVIVTSWRHLCVYGLGFGAGLGMMNNFGTAFGLVPDAAIILPARTRLGRGICRGRWASR